MEYKEALKKLAEIVEHVWTCCAVTMEPELVADLIDELRIIIKNGEINENETNGRSNTPEKTRGSGND